jgi:hypothetical protein
MPRTLVDFWLHFGHPFGSGLGGAGSFGNSGSFAQTLNSLHDPLPHENP